MPRSPSCPAVPGPVETGLSTAGRASAQTLPDPLRLGHQRGHGDFRNRGSGPGRAGRCQLMIETLETGLARLWDDTVRVRSIRGEALGKSTSFALHRLDAHLDSGDVLPVIFKDLNPLRQHQNARRIRRLELGRSRREMWMYHEVLPGLALGTPRLYGCRWEPRDGNLWLFLEDVGRHRLDGQRLAEGAKAVGFAGRLALFEQAAAWAGRFHAATAGMPGDDRLLRYDKEHYERLASRLETCLQRIPQEHQPLVGQALARHGRLAELVGDLPHGLVHGEFFGKNVLLRRDRTAGTIAVVDWETAATGPQYVDLVSISAGRWTRSQRMAMRRAYFDARYSPGAPGADWSQFNEEADVVALLQAVSWLAYWVESDFDDAKYTRHVSRWLRELGATMGEGGPA
jgi:Phosphotransferase enzyme family